MTSNGAVQHISQFAARKEQEWREANEQRITALQLALKEAEEELQRERTRLLQLQDDFKFNLRVVRERDVELERYDVVFSQISGHLSGKESEASELRIRIDELTEKLEQRRDSEQRYQQDYSARIQQVQQESEIARAEKDKLLREEREQFERYRREYRLTLSRLEEDAVQRERETTTAFEDALAQREHEFQLQQDELRSSLHSREAQVRSVATDLERCQQALAKYQEEERLAKELNKQYEKQVLDLKWRSDSEQTTHNARIAELEGDVIELGQQTVVLKRSAEDRYQQLQEATQERERTQVASREAHSEECRKYQLSLAELRAELENSRAECRRLQWCSEEMGRERADDVCRLQRELEEARAYGDQQRASASQDCGARDVETRTLREQVKLARQRLEEHDKELEKYKSELKVSLDRETSMERSHDREHLEWQQRLEQCQHQQHRRNEEIIEALMKARDEATSLAEQRLSELAQRDRVLRLLQASRGQALRTLQHHGLAMPSGDAEIAVALTGEVTAAADLQVQNENLRNVIRHMRQDMEQLGCERAVGNAGSGDGGRHAGHGGHGDRPGEGFGSRSDYSASLEKELCDVKRTCRGLKLALEDAQTGAVSAKAESSTQATAVQRCTEEMRRLRAQLDESRQTVDRLVQEKSESVAALRHEQLRSVHLQQIMSRLKGKDGTDSSALDLPASLTQLADVESRLHTAQWRINQLSGERDRVVQLSNKQRATIRHLETSLAAAATTQCGTSSRDDGAATVNVGRGKYGGGREQDLQLHAHRQFGDYMQRQRSAVEQLGTDFCKQSTAIGGGNSAPLLSANHDFSTSNNSQRSPRSRIPVPILRRASVSSLSSLSLVSHVEVQPLKQTSQRKLSPSHRTDAAFDGTLHHTFTPRQHHVSQQQQHQHQPPQDDGEDSVSLPIATSPESSESMRKVWALLDKGLSEIDSMDSAGAISAT